MNVDPISEVFEWIINNLITILIIGGILLFLHIKKDEAGDMFIEIMCNYVMEKAINAGEKLIQPIIDYWENWTP